MFELLSVAPKKFSIQESMYLMECFTSAHPERANELLRACTSIKVKRLFLALADECNHQWVQELNLKKVVLGRGPRNLVPGGRMHKKYQITLPDEIFMYEGNEKNEGF